MVLMVSKIFLVIVSLYCIAISYANNNIDQCSSTNSLNDNQNCKISFKDYGFKSSKSFSISINNEIQSTIMEPIQLIAAGMRRKNLVVMEVDVYSVGIYISQLKDKELLDDNNNKQIDISTPVLNSNSESMITLGIVLHFVRSVGRKQVVDAIVDALSSPTSGNNYISALKLFSDILLNTIASSGVNKEDEISFVYYSNIEGEAHLAIAFNDKYVGTIENAELRRKLADIYCNKSKSITLEVVKILESRYQ